MSEDVNTIHLVVPVRVSKTFINPDALATYLNKFIEIGINDLWDSVGDDGIESEELDKAVLKQTEWGIPYMK